MVERSGEIVMLRELAADPKVIHKTVRVTGFVKLLLVNEGILMIEHDSFSLYVDVSLVTFSSLAMDSLVQFIGEIRPAFEHPYFTGETSDGDFFLKAKVLRVVDGLDLTLYEEALGARRTFLRAASKQRV